MLLASQQCLQPEIVSYKDVTIYKTASCLFIHSHVRCVIYTIVICNITQSIVANRKYPPKGLFNKQLTFPTSEQCGLTHTPAEHQVRSSVAADELAVCCNKAASPPKSLLGPVSLQARWWVALLVRACKVGEIHFSLRRLQSDVFSNM